METAHFGFSCGVFGIARSAQDYLIPGSKNQPLRKSLLPAVSMNATAGPHTMRVTHKGSVVCDMPVRVLWVSHPSLPEAFLGIESDSPQELLDSLRAYEGQKVELEFTRAHGLRSARAKRVNAPNGRNADATRYARALPVRAQLGAMKRLAREHLERVIIQQFKGAPAACVA